MNNNLYNTGRGIAQNGGTATPQQSTHQRQNAVDAGFGSVRRDPPPRSSDNSKRS